MRAQSSGLVVLGRSSFSRNSSTQASSRCCSRRPFCPEDRNSLMAIFLARSTMFWIIAPELKSLKYRTSSAEVAAQVSVAAKGERLDVVQQGSTAYVVNRSAGSLRRVDGATFEVSAPVTPVDDARGGLVAFAGPHGLYALDTRRGVLTATDPITLANQGGLVSLAVQIEAQAATVDEAGRLWVLDTATGDLIWLDRGTRHLRQAAASSGAGLLTLADGAPVLVGTG